jgi:hypothetical protein
MSVSNSTRISEALTSIKPVNRPYVVNDEKHALLARLNSQREHVLGGLEGLSEDDLRRPVLPSGWTRVGMVRHLALEVEQLWLRGAFAGQADHADLRGRGLAGSGGPTRCRNPRSVPS